MRSFGALVTSTISSVLLLILNTFTFYNKYKTGSTYYWVNGILGVLFLFFLIANIRDIIKKNYVTSTQ
jgi:uncharacterized membrane protein YdcZ (DUF606 family)